MHAYRLANTNQKILSYLRYRNQFSISMHLTVLEYKLKKMIKILSDVNLKFYSRVNDIRFFHLILNTIVFFILDLIYLPSWLKRCFGINARRW